MQERVTLPDDHQASMAASENMFAQQMLKAGKRIQTSDGHVITPKNGRPSSAGAVTTSLDYSEAYPETDAIDDRFIIDLDIDEVDARDIVLRRKQGDDIILRIPSPKMESAFMIGRFQNLIQQQYQKLAKTSNEQEANRINQALKELHVKMIRLLIPDIDNHLLVSFNMRVYNQIVAIAQEMIEQSLAASNQTPLTYVRRIYRLMGQPYGDTDRGLGKWLREHFQDVEEALGDTDLPNG